MRVFVNNKSAGSLLDMQDESQNRLIRKAIGGAFLTRNLLEYEPDIDTTLTALLRRITTHPTFNLYQTLQFFQLDFLIKMAFSESPGHLSQGWDVLGLAKQGSLRIWHWHLWQPLPYLEQFIYHSRIWSRFISRPTRWAKTGIERWEARKQQIKERSFGDKEGSGGGGQKNDLLQKYIAVSDKYPDTIKPAMVANLVNSTISAGGDTTAGMMATMIYFLLKNPFAYRKLREELEGAMRDGVLSLEPKYTELNTLPYLDAVMKETLRLNPPLAAPLERVVPKGGAVLSGVPVPEGTVVGCTGRVVHLDQEVYGMDSEAFRPERWLEDEGKVVRMERGYMPYGSGGRICLGRYVVELEVKRVVPAFVLGFEVS
jgi:cytochrome P450